MTRKRVKRVLLVIICLFLFVGIIIPYGQVEILTITHGNEFEKGYLQTNMIETIEYLKVMTYSTHKAKIYYVEEDKVAGHIVEFSRDNTGEWKYTKWETVWSTSGSASGFIWPYYR